MAQWERPAGGYTPTNHSQNITKYQQDSAADTAISSVKVDGDINKAFQGLNDIDSRTPPDVTGQTGKYLSNDGVNTLWSGLPDTIDSTFRVKGSVDATKQLAFEVDTITTGTTRTLTAQDASGTIYITGGQDIAVADGGTNISSYAIGDILYASATGVLSKLPIGSVGQMLKVAASGAAPEWASGVQMLIMEETQANNVQGGTFTGGAWRTRVLNTTVINEITGASLSSNQFTLPAGTYEFEASAPAYFVENHKARLWNLTTSTEQSLGTTEYSGASGNGCTTRSFIRSKFTLAVPTTLEIQHTASGTRATDGFGKSANLQGTTEKYTTVYIRKIA